MKVLFLTNLLPYPLDNGGKLKTNTTLTSLKNGGHTVYLLCFKETRKPMIEEERYLLDVCKIVEQVYQKITTAENKKYMVMLALKSLFTKFPLSVFKYASKEMRDKIYSLKNEDIECIYIDHLQMYVYAQVCKSLWPSAKFVLDEHNCEAMIMKRNTQSTRNVLKKAYLWLETCKLKKFESEAIANADTTIVLSEQDYSFLKKQAGKDFRHSIIPIGIPDKGVKKKKCSTCEGLNILFIGTLTWEPNNQGLIWFIDEVVPLMERAGIRYRLYVVGKKPSDKVKSRADNNPNIILTGYVQSVDSYYDKCHIIIVPLFIGSGQRVKLIEAFSKGMPAVSTTIGAEGLRYIKDKDIIVADNAQDFCKAIIKLEDGFLRDSMSKRVRKIYEDNYSPEAVQASILKAVEQ